MTTFKILLYNVFSVTMIIIIKTEFATKDKTKIFFV